MVTQTQATEGRLRELLQKGITTHAQYDQAVQQLLTAQSQMESAEPPPPRWSRRAKPATAHAAATCSDRSRCNCVTYDVDRRTGRKVDGGAAARRLRMSPRRSLLSLVDVFW